MDRLRIAFLHLRPRVGDLVHNYACLESAVRLAADWGAEWILTPELSLPGCHFVEFIGTDWIVPRPDTWIGRVSDLSAELDTTIFLGHLERDHVTQRLYNSLVVIQSGCMLGAQRKMNVLPFGVERWATRGADPVPVHVGGLTVGLLVGADAYTPDPARRLHRQGAQVLVSAAAWAPQPYGPKRCWEERTHETGLPLFVCNRTGQDSTLNFTAAETTVVHDGQRIVTFRAADSSVVLVDWDVAAQTMIAWRHEPLEVPVSGNALVS